MIPPVVSRFLFCCHLSIGCHIALLFTLIRASLCASLSLIFIPLALTPEKAHLTCGELVKFINGYVPSIAHSDNELPFVYYCYEAMLAGDTMLVVAVLLLWHGICKKSACALSSYVTIRTLIWIIEAVSIIILSLKDRILLPGYLVLLLLLVMELYLLIVVRSYGIQIHGRRISVEVKKTKPESTIRDSELGKEINSW